MKKVIITLCIAVFAVTLMAQTPDTTRTEEYCNLIAASKMLRVNMVTVSVDYGDTKAPQSIIGADGNPITEFNSYVEALNYMSQSGWIFVFAYKTKAGSFTFLNCLLKRKVVSK